MSEYIEKVYKEITSRNPVRDASFPQGLKDFKFSVGQGYGFIPAQSYFKVDLEIVKYNAGNRVKPAVGDGVTFSDGVCGNLFNNIYFNMGGQTVSSITTGLSQCDILKNRLTKSKAWNETIGLTQGFNPTFESRNKIMNSAATNSATSVYNTQNKFENTFTWQPAIGIFDVDYPLGCGEYDIQLNPSQDYQSSGISTPNLSDGGGDLLGLTLGTADGNFGLVVKDIKFYACVVRCNLAASGTVEHVLYEMSVHNGNVPKGTVDNIDLEITVPSSTRALTMFLQDQQVGKFTTLSPSKFHLAGNNQDALSLVDYQIEYGGMTKPTVRYKSTYSANNLGIQQRYINSALESGQYFNPAGFESFNEYLERGPFMHETFMKSADNLATRAHIAASYVVNPTGQDADKVRDARIFIVAHHTRTISITRQNGLIVSIVSQNR